MAVASEGRPVRAALLQKVCGDAEMFALGAAVARVVQMASSEDEGTNELAYYVLSDPALTQRILRLSNTATYRTASGTAVTTISRAISLLGFDNVKTTALAMLLVDALGSKHAAAVRSELEAALCASLVGRELARRSFYQGAEEAAIGALFKNLGALLVASHELDRYREVQALQQTGKHSLGQASQMILGCSFESLTEAVLLEWKIPAAIISATAPLPAGSLKAAASKGDWMKQVASFSAEAARLLARGRRLQAAELKALEQRYGSALNLDAAALSDVFAAVQEEMTGLLQSMNLQSAPPEEAAHEGLPNVLLLATLDAEEPEPSGTHASGKPLNARDLLLAGVQDVTQMRASGAHRVNELIQAVLETLYRSLGFRFATACLKDPRSGQYRARIAFGEDHARRQAGFCFPMAPARDLFHLAMENDADLMIADASAPKIRELIPDWHRSLLPDARSFIVLPLVVNRVQVGLFYADRTRPAPEGVPPDETALIKALKSQVLVALTP
ncbi:HDOD domain-containing protein [Massilia sp. TS11]|uniref:HDOD domain-containing protein n=1 Tax=Massilia sp. TS11 TaxID=2908003 RepID=UPI001EDC7F67|nr:HDOD domain-containing protein [Massilia sp. TS11]MCG2584791.1 HDOD domain-containing protein [Massilia sp. TS11]